MKKSFLILALAAILALPSFAEGPKTPIRDLPTADYLNLVRHPHGRESWAKLDGTLTHRRKGADDVESKIFMGILFTPERTLAQIVVDGGEAYRVGQGYDVSPDSTDVKMLSKPKDGEKPLLSRIGLRAQDIAMSFLFWNARLELPRDSAKGQDCRVFIFDSPDKTESVKAFISADACFPIRAEWMKNGEEKPYRTMEIDSIKHEGDFYLPGSLLLYGPGWKTKIEFDEISAGYSKDGLPADLFPEKKQ